MRPDSPVSEGLADTGGHVPVLLREVVESLAPGPDAVIVDGTFGAGGYARAVLETGARVIAIDRDPTAIAAGQSLVAEAAGRLTLVQGRFADMAEIAADVGVPAVDGVMLDIGVSSMQIDAPERGFSFQETGPLDMRMSQSGPSAADIVNGAEEEALADIFFHYGEERRARAIARTIVKLRAEKPIVTTADLVAAVGRVLGHRKVEGRHPATRTFQALRIAVNDELGELARALFAAERILKPGGRLAVVTFHSLEDRIVKRFLQARIGRDVAGSRHLPPTMAPAPASFQLVNQRPVIAGDAETSANPRARSAKLRAAIRTAAAAQAEDMAELGLPPIAAG
jgi:16S rRNA (cytosine1402-N4)-methyltransferase